jgi:hypothetical protein
LTNSPPKQTASSEKVKKPLPPLVIPERLPDEIITAYVENPGAMILHLEAYSKSGLGWDEYANKKIDSKLRSQMKQAFKEIRRNGFLFAYIDHRGEKKKIVWYQVADHIYADNETNRKNRPVKAILCNLCENKNCRVKYPEKKEDAKLVPCWTRNYSYMQKLREAGRIK